MAKPTGKIKPNSYNYSVGKSSGNDNGFVIVVAIIFLALLIIVYQC